MIRTVRLVSVPESSLVLEVSFSMVDVGTSPSVAMLVSLHLLLTPLNPVLMTNTSVTDDCGGLRMHLSLVVPTAVACN